eukprot:gb/GEZN01002603.1/.p1 GENE.gb/GEZN01002603.1/~~gb/GEZN01002603.1/.p1  ORF type:complete len:776 (+),score=88.63 gb/GEZN01002603.1/:150-2330(+)
MPSHAEKLDSVQPPGSNSEEQQQQQQQQQPLNSEKQPVLGRVSDQTEQPSNQKEHATPTPLKQYTHVHDFFQAQGMTSLQELQAKGPLAGRFKVVGLLGGGTDYLDRVNQIIADIKGEEWVGPSKDGFFGSALMEELVEEGGKGNMEDTVAVGKTAAETWKESASEAAGAVIMKLLGAGSFGTVFRAIDLVTGEGVAIKIFAVGRSPTASEQAIIDEQRIAQQAADDKQAAIMKNLGIILETGARERDPRFNFKVADLNTNSVQELADATALVAGNNDFVKELKNYFTIRDCPNYATQGSPYIVDIKGVLYEPSLTAKTGGVVTCKTADVKTDIPWEFSTPETYKTMDDWTGCNGVGLKAMVLELCGGGMPRNSKQDYPADLIWSITENWEKGLGFLHGCDLVHHDFKNANSLLCGAGGDQAKLMDFGLTIPVDTPSTGGTPAYMPPEVYDLHSELWVDLGGLSKIFQSKKTYDYYALGVSIGNLAFTDPDRFKIKYKSTGGTAIQYCHETLPWSPAKKLSLEDFAVFDVQVLSSNVDEFQTNSYESWNIRRKIVTYMQCHQNVRGMFNLNPMVHCPKTSVWTNAPAAVEKFPTSGKKPLIGDGVQTRTFRKKNACTAHDGGNALTGVTLEYLDGTTVKGGLLLSDINGALPACSSADTKGRVLWKVQVKDLLAYKTFQETDTSFLWIQVGWVVGGLEEKTLSLRFATSAKCNEFIVWLKLGSNLA